MTLEEFANETFGGSLTDIERLFVKTLARDLANEGYRVVKLEDATDYDGRMGVTIRNGTHNITEELT